MLHISDILSKHQSKSSSAPVFPIILMAVDMLRLGTLIRKENKNDIKNYG